MNRIKKLISGLLFIALTIVVIFSTITLLDKGHSARTKGSTLKVSAKDDIKKGDVLRDGKWRGTALGYAGNVTTEITIKNGKIIDAKVISHMETPEYFAIAKRILQSIIEQNTYDVDVIAGCTTTCDAIKDGVHKALLKARGKKATEVKDKNKTIHIDPRKNKPHVKPGIVQLVKTNKLKDGVYYGYGNGYNGLIKVAIQIKNGKLISINVLGHNEDRAYFNLAQGVISRMLQNRYSVDTITGATVSSRGIIDAVNDALRKAGSNANSTNGAKAFPVITVKQENKKAEKHSTIEKVENQKLKDGTYLGYGNGYGGQLKLSVTIQDGKISDIKVIKHNEDLIYYNQAKIIINKMLNGDKDIDVISGATRSSNGIIDAINDALRKSGSKDKNIIKKPVSPSKPIAPDKPVKPVNPDKPNKPIKPIIPENPKVDVTKKLKDGTYEGIGEGYNGPIKLNVTIKDGKISKIDVISHNEDRIYYLSAVEIIDKVVNGADNVDTVTGATFSSKGIINAINNALSKAGLKDISIKDDEKNQNDDKKDDKTDKYADGIWYGQAYGFHKTDLLNSYSNKNQISSIVTIKNGKITKIELEHFGDDLPYMEHIKQKNGFEKINKEIIKTNNIKSAKKTFIDDVKIHQAESTKLGKIHELDAVSTATRSGNAYVQSIQNALDRSIKFNKDHKRQNIKFMRMVGHEDKGKVMTFNYKEVFDIGKFIVEVGYTKPDSEKLIVENLTLRELIKKGVTFNRSDFEGINDNLEFIASPKNKNDFSEKRDFDLEITDPISGARVIYRGIQASRLQRKYDISKIILTGPNNQKVEVPWKDVEEFSQNEILNFNANEIVDVKVIGKDGQTVKLDIKDNPRDKIQENGFGTRKNSPNILIIELKNIENKKSNPIAYDYRYKSLKLKITKS